MLISRGDAIVAIAMSIAADQYVLSIPPSIALSVMESITGLRPKHYLDKGVDEIMVAEDDNVDTASGAMRMYENLFGANTIASVAVLPVGTRPGAVAVALARGATVPVENPPKLILLSPSNDDPNVNVVVDLMLEALKAGAPEHAAYLLDSARAYEERYGQD
jgi:hypothetical protein